MSKGKPKMLRLPDGGEVPEWRITFAAIVFGIVIVGGAFLALLSMGIRYTGGQ